jgi:hypothetical protein
MNSWQYATNSKLEVHDPEVLLAQYQAMQDDMASLRNQLKGILTQALRGRNSHEYVSQYRASLSASPPSP